MVSFEEQVTIIRESLAAQLEKEEQWAEAASVLAGIDLDSGGWDKKHTLLFLLRNGCVFQDSRIVGVSFGQKHPNHTLFPYLHSCLSTTLMYRQDYCTQCIPAHFRDLTQGMKPLPTAAGMRNIDPLYKLLE